MPESLVAIAFKPVLLMTRVLMSIMPKSPTDSERNVNKLVQPLVGKSSDDQPPFEVLAIVGMIGSGKTTLAKKIYHHKAVKKNFNCRAWITVSQLSDASALLLEVLRQMSGSDRNTKGGTEAGDAVDEPPGLDELGNLLQNVLRRKRSLLVLDDVWDSESLTSVLPVLTSAGVKKIVITSQNVLLSADKPRWLYHEIRCLSEEDTWKLFEKVCSKNARGLDARHRKSAMEMLRKCEGLPLAIVALGDLMKTKETIKEWERELDRIKDTQGACVYEEMKETLENSYDKLPEHLKPCFLHLGLFPEGLSISAARLVRMWMAEEFIKGFQDDSKSEAAARRYLQELIEYNMVQVEKRNYAGEVKTIRVHNIMRYLCLAKARELDFLALSSPDSEASGTNSQRSSANNSRRLNLLVRNSHLKSGVSTDQFHTSIHKHTDANLVTLDLTPMLKSFKSLRVLDLFGIKTSDGTLPKKIGSSLPQLRYLRIRHTNIDKLPKSIRKLSELLTLDYRNVCARGKIKVPNVLSGLKRLRHLYLPTEMSIIWGGLKLHSIKYLQTLWGVIGGNWKPKEAAKLNASLKKLYVHGISCPDELESVLNCPIIRTHDDLRVLVLDWHGFELQSLEAISSKRNLQKLRLLGKISDELNHFNFNFTLQKLELHYTQLRNPETMSALGRLPCLKSLTLAKDSYVGSIWTCSGESFPQLEELQLMKLHSLEQWNMIKGAMPCLKKFSIVSCINLCSLPEALKFILNLEKLEIDSMPYSFCSRLQQPKEQSADSIGQDFHIVQHIPDVQIRNACQSTL